MPTKNIVSMLKKVFGAAHENTAERPNSELVHAVNLLEGFVRGLSDDALRAKTGEFRQRLHYGTSLDDLLPEAFAVVREAARRTLGQRHYDVQLIGGAVLHQGKVAEIKHGEGKSLIAALPAYLNALTGEGVHVVTVNDYHARRDVLWMGPVYHLLGLTVGCIQRDAAYRYDPEQVVHPGGDHQYLTTVSRAEVYSTDVLYGTNNEFGYDYLRDNMVISADQRIQRLSSGRPNNHFAILYEVDNILIDEALTPLIISNPTQQPLEHYSKCARLARRFRQFEDYTVNEHTHGVALTGEGVRKSERHLRVGNLHAPENLYLLQSVENALVAQTQMVENRDYVVSNGEVIIVDEFTGRLKHGHRWSDGLHQAVEAKAGLQVQNDTITYAQITNESYFRMYRRLAGMTATAATEAEEFHQIYGLEVVAVPTNLPVIREDNGDVIFAAKKGARHAVVESIVERSSSGQPVLVVTTSVESSKALSEHLRKRGVVHQVMNDYEEKAPIVAQAGRSGAVTVCTNIAGCCTDIILGGADTDRDDWQEEHDRIVALGGLHVIGAEHHEMRRMDNQLIECSGHRGEPGSSQFFASMEDGLLQRYGDDHIKNVMNWPSVNDDKPLENTLIAKAISDAQMKAAEHRFNTRKHLLNLDDVLNQQRSVIYEQRSRILVRENLRGHVLNMLHAEFDRLVDTYLQSRRADDWDVRGLLDSLSQISPPPLELETPEKLLQRRRKQIEDILRLHAETLYQSLEQTMGRENMDALVRLLLLRAIDTHWVNHMWNLTTLRAKAGFQAARQEDQLRVYRSEAEDTFAEMLLRIQHDVTHTMFHVTLAPETPAYG